MKHRQDSIFYPCTNVGLQTIAVSIFLIVSGGAANITWDGGIDGTGTDWMTAANWDGDVAPADNLSTDNAYFNTLTTGQPTLNSARSVAGIELETPTGGWTLSGSATLTLGAKGIDAQTFQNGTNTISVANIVMGSSSTSTWQLSVSSDTFTQPTTTQISSNIQVHKTGQFQIQSPRSSNGGIGTVNLSGIISNTTGETTSGQVKYLGGSASRNTFNVTGLNSYTGGTLVSQAVVNFNSLADDGTPSALGSSGIINVTENGSFSTLVFNGTVPASTNRRLTIGLASASATGASNITNNATLAANTLSFTSTASVINGGSGNRSLVLNGSNTGNNTFAQSIDNTGTGTTSFGKQSAGRWILTNPNSSYTGATTLAGGFLHVAKLADGGANSSIGAATNVATNLVFNGGELTYVGTGDSTDRLMSFAAGGNITNNGTGPLSFTHTGAITHTGTIARTLNLGGTNPADNNTFAPQIVDGAGAAVTSLGSRGAKWTLTNTNTFTGGVIFGTASTTGGTLTFSDDAALGASAGAITFTGSGNLVASGNATLGAARTITVASGRAANFGITSGLGTLLTVNSKITGAGGVSRVSGSAFGTGAVRYANDTNDYTGNFSTRFGTDEFTSVKNAGIASALGAGTSINADNSASATVLRHIGSANSTTDRPIVWSATIGQLFIESSDTGTVGFLNTTPLVTGNGNKTLSLGGSSTGGNTFAQPVGDSPGSGVTAFQKYGTGKWIVTAENTYSGPTTVSEGILVLGASASMEISSTLSIAAGATLDLSAKAAAFDIPVSQTLTGAGSVTGQSLNVAGAVAPGSNGIGTLSVTSLTLGPDAAMEMQINSSSLTCDQLAITGNLVIDPDTALNVSDIAAIPAIVVDETLTLATYTGSVSGTFKDLPEGATVNVGPSTFTISYNNGNAITLVNGTGGGDAYTDWIDTFTTLNTPAKKDKSADPDGDGKTNLEEYAFDGNPESGASDGKIQSSITTVGATPHLMLSIPVRDTASFTGSPSLTSAEVDGVSYTIRGSYDLSAFGETVVEVIPAIVTTPLLSTGWSYKTFRLSAATGSQPRGFLRAEASSPTAP